MLTTADISEARAHDSSSCAVAAESPIPEHARCIGCGYALRGLTEWRCPECGFQFDPRLPKTMDLGRSAKEFPPRWTLRPPRRVFQLCVVAAALVALLAFSVPGGFLWIGISSALLWTALAAIWSLWLLAAALIAIFARRRDAFTKPNLRGWSFVPAALLLTIFLCRLHVPIFVTFTICKPWMDDAVQQTRSDPTGGSGIKWIGPLPASYVDYQPRGFHFCVSGTGMLDLDGFAYFPDGKPPGDEAQYYQPLYGGWWIWHEPVW